MPELHHLGVGIDVSRRPELAHLTEFVELDATALRAVEHLLRGAADRAAARAAMLEEDQRMSARVAERLALERRVALGEIEPPPDMPVFQVEALREGARREAAKRAHRRP